MFGRIGASFSPWQSQFGDTSVIRETWKQGLPSQTACEYSAILQPRISLALLLSFEIALKEHAPMQRPHPLQMSGLIHAFPPS